MMPSDPSRIPTAPKEGWTTDTALDYALALIAANDKRYEQHFEAMQRAMELGLSERRASVDAAFAAQNSAMDAAFTAQKDAIGAALASADRAVTKAELATEKRFEGVNEFRATLDQQQRTLIPRSEVAVLVDGLNDKFTNVTRQLEELKARHREQVSEQQGVKGGWGYAVGVVGFLVALLSLGFMATRALEPEPVRATPAPTIIYVPAQPGTLIPSTPPAATPPQ